MKNSVKNYSVFIVFMLIVVGIITFCVFYVFGNVESENYSFGKDGYALYVSKKDNYQTKSYSFNSGHYQRPQPFDNLYSEHPSFCCSFLLFSLSSLESPWQQ